MVLSVYQSYIFLLVSISLYSTPGMVFVEVVMLNWLSVGTCHLLHCMSCITIYVSLFVCCVSSTHLKSLSTTWAVNIILLYVYVIDWKYLCFVTADPKRQQYPIPQKHLLASQLNLQLDGQDLGIYVWIDCMQYMDDCYGTELVPVLSLLYVNWYLLFCSISILNQHVFNCGWYIRWTYERLR